VSPERGPPGVRVAAFFRLLFTITPGRLDLTFGLRAAVFVVVPLFLGLATGQVLAGVLVTLGTLNLFMVQAPRPGHTPVAVIVLAVGTNALAWGLGTVVGTTTGPLQWALVGVGVFGILLTKRYARFNQLALFAAVMYVVAVGLPGGLSAALLQGALIAVGGLWGLVGVILPAYVAWVERPLRQPEGSPPPVPLPAGVTVGFSLAVAGTVAFGLALGPLLGLPRDYWVMLTVLCALHPALRDTFQYATMRAVGTIAGAAVAFALTVSVTDPWLLGGIVVVAAAMTFAVRAVNYTHYAIVLTVFLILLLNLAYQGGPRLAVDRVIDTAIGGTLAIVAGLGLALAKRGPRFRWLRDTAPPSAHVG
jgi:hypothetical protein